MSEEGYFSFRPYLPKSSLFAVYTDIITGRTEFCGKVVRHSRKEWEALIWPKSLGVFKTRYAAAIALVKA